MRCCIAICDTYDHYLFAYHLLTPTLARIIRNVQGKASKKQSKQHITAQVLSSQVLSSQVLSFLA